MNASSIPHAVTWIIALAAWPVGALAQPPTPAPPASQALPPVVVGTSHYQNAVGSSDAASEGVVNASLIQRRPILRTAEVLEFVPGVIVSQHSGDGKANQYYLRGFNLDHGTDFATFVDGMPVNMPTHAHGQGYSDLNFLIPELVRSIHYRKGPYAAEDGDFASAGTARIALVDRLARGQASITLGEGRYARALLAHSVALQTGELLYAADVAHNDGPWALRQNHRRFNGLLRYSLADGDSRQSFTLMGYQARWRATDQVPQRAVDSGQIDRYGFVDPTDHGQTRRHSLSWQRLQSVADGEWRANAYLIASHLDLYSNFTYFLDDEVNGDQFEQAEDRLVFGAGLSRLWRHALAGHESQSTLGLQWRHDRLDPVGLYRAVGGRRADVTQESRVRQASLGLYAQNDTRWQPWLRSVAGLRADHVDVDVRSSIADNSGQRADWIASPKLSLVMGPWWRTEFFVNLGQGFHSNDARGMTARVKADGIEPTEAAVPLVRTRGSELGVRSEWLPGLQTSLALWQLQLDSELVFVGDAGETEASDASRRYGIEFNNHYVARPWLLLDADVAVSRARFASLQGEPGAEGRHVPGAVETVVSLGATLTELGPWSAQFQLRYFGPRALTEDNSQRSRGTTLAYARLGYKLSKDVGLNLDVFNLFDRQASDIDYFYESRLPGEPSGGVADRHFHPAEPRSVRVSLSLAF